MKLRYQLGLLYLDATIAAEFTIVPDRTTYVPSETWHKAKDSRVLIQRAPLPDLCSYHKLICLSFSGEDYITPGIAPALPRLYEIFEPFQGYWQCLTALDTFQMLVLFFPVGSVNSSHIILSFQANLCHVFYFWVTYSWEITYLLSQGPLNKGNDQDSQWTFHTSHRPETSSIFEYWNGSSKIIPKLFQSLPLSSLPCSQTSVWVVWSPE